MSTEILRKSQLCCGLSTTQINRVAEAVHRVSFASSDVVFRQDEYGDSMFIVTRGRVKIEVTLGNGHTRLVDQLGMGDHFGELAMLTSGRRATTMTAVMDSELLELKQDAFQRLLRTVPGLAANVCRTLGYQLRRETAGRKPRVRPQVIGLVNNSWFTHALTWRIAAALESTGDRIEVLTESIPRHANAIGTIVEQIPPRLRGREKVAWLQYRLARVAPHRGHVLLDITMRGVGDDVSALLSQCEQIWWLVEPPSVATAIERLQALVTAEPMLASRVHVVWIVRDGDRSIPPLPRGLTIARPDFKVVLDDTLRVPSRQQRRGISRLVRHVHGTRIGLALGGGGARGLAHLGVLRALEHEEIYVDLISGTSIGALMALPYACGWDLDDAIAAFKQDLTPGRMFRHVPRGNHWFMLFKFRMRGWEPMLRRHFGDVSLEQLRIPLSTVAVDLVSGRQVIRDRGDAVNAILESVNLPGIARPILRDGMALVDGGIFNNVPADLLPDRGADRVVGIDIATQLSPCFAHNTPTTMTHRMRRPGLMETIMRAHEVQDYEITALRTRAVDLMISVDTSRFAFADFSKATELADVGRRAAEQAMPQLKKLLATQEKTAAAAATRFVCVPAD